MKSKSLGLNSKQNFRILIFLFAAILLALTYFNLFNNGQSGPLNSSTQIPRNSVTQETKTGVAASETSTGDQHSQTGSISTEASIEMMLAYLKSETSGRDEDDFFAAASQSAKDLSKAFEILEGKIRSSPDEAVEYRMGLYGALAQIVFEAKKQNLEMSRQTMGRLSSLISAELNYPEKIDAAAMNSLPESSKEELAHHSIFLLEGNRLFVQSLPSQVSAMYLLGLIGSEASKNELESIASNRNYSLAVRENANHLLYGNLFVTTEK